MKNNIREQRAITLVALIITIIVLLILAIVSINLVMNGGIINKSKTSVDKYSQEEVEEQIKLAYSEWQMGQYTGVTDTAAKFIQDKLNEIYGPGTVTNVTEENGTFTVEFANGKQYTYNVATGVASKVKTVAEYPDATPGQANNDENTKYTSDNKTAVIPKGYTLDATQTSIDNGLVITKGGNEWVWIPVANVTDLYTENSTNNEWILCGTSGESKVVSQYASKARTDVRSDLKRTTPGTTDDPYYREPDMLTGNNWQGNPTDTSSTNISAAGFNIFNDMATSLKDDYKNMIESVRKNGGFYVGRYELSSAGTKKQEAPLTDANWYNSYKACKDIDSSGVVTAMIWGCQWDQVCNFIHSSGDQVSLTKSASYGNYSNSTVSGHGTKQVTGYSDTWKANNIYDLAGNCWEWTQEAGYTNFRAYRGGSCDSSGVRYPVAYRGNGDPTDTYNVLSSRPQLYVK